jgi:hypothetical protein
MIIHTQLFLVIVLNSLACLGVHCVTREGMLFGPVAEYIRSIIGEYSCKPLFDCPPCMASVWGLLGWFYFMPSLAIVPYLLVLCGVNALISKIYYYGD